jgi:carotenoid cleavage dioxygenase-like enzyme
MSADATDYEGAAGAGITWTGQGVWCGEPLFVSDGEGSEEDDGCVLCICYDAAEARSFLLVLQVPSRSTSHVTRHTLLVTRHTARVTRQPQASTMTELARAYAPVPIPLGLHSLYADAATSTLA